MYKIHPSSTVDPQVELGDGVEIGPHCVITGNVSIGAGTRLIAQVHIVGPVAIGEENLFYPFCCIGFEPQVRKWTAGGVSGGVVIGDRNIFRETVTVHRATGPKPTTMGHRNYFMINSHLGHDVVMGNDCTLANSSLLGGHVEMHDHVTLGGNTAVHQFCRVGRLVMQSGSTAVTQDIPPFCTVYNNRSIGSLNLVGLRRAGYREHIRDLHEGFNILYRQGYPRSRAVDLMDKRLGHNPLVAEMVKFIRESKRGVTPYGRKNSMIGAAEDR